MQFYILIAALGSVTAALFLLLYVRTAKRRQAAMATFHLKPDAAKKDFQIFMAGTLGLAVSFTSYTVAAWINDTAVLRQIKLLIAVMVIPFTLVYYRWLRRFP